MLKLTMPLNGGNERRRSWPVWKRLLERSTGDILILIVTLTICASVIGAGIAVALRSLLAPEINSAGAWALVSDSINTLIGLLAGFIAGRTERGGQSASEIQPPPRDFDDPPSIDN
jgi:hypothetical protein